MIQMKLKPEKKMRTTPGNRGAGGKSSGRIRLIAAFCLVSATLFAACVFTYSWFSSNMNVMNGDIDLGELKAEMTVYNNVDGDGDGLLDSLSAGEGIGEVSLYGFDEIKSADSVGVKYIAMTNNGDIDIKAFLKCTYESQLENEFLDYFHFRITDVTGDVRVGQTGGKTELQSLYSYDQKNTPAVTQIKSQGVSLTSLTSNIKMGVLAKPSGENKTTSYYKLEYCCADMPTSELDRYTALTDEIKTIRLDTVVTLKQINAPDLDDTDAGQDIQVNTGTAFLNALNSAGDGDTIYLVNNIELPESTNVTILNRVNLNLNGYSLTIHGNLAYDIASSGYCQLNVKGTSALNIDGSLLVDAPNATFEILGSGAQNIVLGTGANADQVRFYVNSMRDPGEKACGYIQTAVSVLKKLSDSATTLADMEIGSNSRITIASRSKTGTLVAVSGAHDIMVDNYGEIKSINFSRMLSSKSGAREIYIRNGNKFTDTNAVKLPAWSVGWYSKSIKGDAIGEINTKIVNLAGAKTGWTPSGSVNFVQLDIENEGEDTASVVRIAPGKYRVNLKASTETVEGLLAEFFANNPEVAETVSLITSLEIKTYNDGKVSSADFTYINGTMSAVSKLDLSGAYIQNEKIPVRALYGKTTLSEIVLPASETAIGDSAFEGTKLRTLTLTTSITSIGSNAFKINRGASGIECIDVIWDSSEQIPENILNSFGSDYTVLFMYDYVLNTFKAGLPAGSKWETHAYEMYDFVLDSYYYKRLSGTTAQIIYYAGTISDSMLPSKAEHEGVSYVVTTVGVNAFRRAISIAPAVQKLNIVFPNSYKTILDNAFYGIRLSKLDLSNVQYIATGAFSKALIESSSERPVSFEGMLYVGENAFSGTTFGTVPATLAEVTKCGTLDLSGKYSISDKALASVSAYGLTLKLEGLDKIGEYVLSGAELYGCTVDADNTTLIDKAAFKDVFSSNQLCVTSDISAINVPQIGEGAFENAYIGTVRVGIIYSGISTANSSTDTWWGGCPNPDEATYTEKGIFSVTGGRTVRVNKLTLDGRIPEYSSVSSLGISANSVSGTFLVYGEVELTGACTMIPAGVFNGYNQTNRYVVIGALNYTGLNIIGESAFSYTYIKNAAALDFGGITLKDNAFYGTVFDFLPGVILNGGTFGNYSFGNTQFGMLTSLDLNGAMLEEYVFAGAKFDALTSLNIRNVSAASDVGEMTFYGATFSMLESLNINTMTVKESYFAKANFKKLVVLSINGTKLEKDAFAESQFIYASDISIAASDIGEGAFRGSTFYYASDLTLDSTKIGVKAFYEARFKSSTSLTQALDYTVFNITVTSCNEISTYAFAQTKFGSGDKTHGANVTALNVSRIGAGAFEAPFWGNIELGITDASIDTSVSNSNCWWGGEDTSYSVFGYSQASKTTVAHLIINGRIPEYSSRNSLGTNYYSISTPTIQYNTVYYNDFVIYNKLTLKSNCTKIPDGTFCGYNMTYRYTEIDELVMESPDIQICNNAFSCSIIGNSTLDLTGKSIGAYAFAGSQFTGLHTLDLTSSAVGEYAFNSAALQNMTSFVFNDSVIGDYCFGKALLPLLGSLTLAGNGSSYGTSVFASADFDSLTVLNIDSMTVGDAMFSSADFNLLRSLSISDAVLGADVFMNASFAVLDTLDLSNTAVGSRAFNGVSFKAVESVYSSPAYVPTTITVNGAASIGNYAFAGLKFGSTGVGQAGNITVINASQIGYAAFETNFINTLRLGITDASIDTSASNYNCWWGGESESFSVFGASSKSDVRVENLIIDGRIPEYMSKNSLGASYYSTNNVSRYLANSSHTNNVTVVALTFTSNCTVIPAGSFCAYDYTWRKVDIGSVNFSGSNIVIRTRAFSGTTIGSTAVDLTNVPEIDSNAFELVKFARLLSLDLRNTTVGDQAFYKASFDSLTGLYYNGAILGNGIFQSCVFTALKVLPLESFVSASGTNQNLFSYATFTSATELSVNSTSIPSYCFMGAKFPLLTEITLYGMTVGEKAFQNAELSMLRRITLSESTVGSMAFRGLNAGIIEHLSINNSVLSESVFYESKLRNDPSVTNVAVFKPLEINLDGCSYIGVSAFRESVFGNGSTEQGANLSAMNVPKIEAGAFEAPHWNTIKLGITDPSINTSNTNGNVWWGGDSIKFSVFGYIAASATQINLLEINGEIPQYNATNSLGANYANMNSAGKAAASTSTVYNIITVGTIDINAGCTQIPSGAFRGYDSSYRCLNISNIDMTDTAAGISEYMFANDCILDKTLELSEKTIAGYSFDGASFSELISFDLTGTTVKEYAFRATAFRAMTQLDLSGATINPNSFRNVIMPELLVLKAQNSVIGDSSFVSALMNKIVTIDLSGAESIGDTAFVNTVMDNTPDVDMRNVLRIGTCVFDTESKLGTVSLGITKPADLSDTNKNAYYSSNTSVGIFATSTRNRNVSIEKLVIDGNIPQYACDYSLSVSHTVSSRLEYGEIEIKESCTSIPALTFAGTDSAKNTYIGKLTVLGNTMLGTQSFYRVFASAPGVEWKLDRVTEIGGSNVFSMMTGGPMTLSFDSLESITGTYVFTSSSAIESIKFGKNVTFISGGKTFASMSSLKQIVLPGTTVAQLDSSLASFPMTTCKIYVPASVISSYKTAPYWSEIAGCFSPLTNLSVEWEYILISGTDEVSLEGYLGSDPGTTLTVPSILTVGEGESNTTYTVTELGISLVEGLSITALSIPSTVKYINPELFNGSSITTVTVDSANTNYKFASGALYSPDGSVLIRYLPGNAATSFTVPAKIRAISKNAFTATPNLAEVIITSNPYISDGAFAGSSVATYKLSCTTPPTLGSDTAFGDIRVTSLSDDYRIQYTNNGTISIVVPSGCGSVYKSAYNYNRYSGVITESSALVSTLPSLLMTEAAPEANNSFVSKYFTQGSFEYLLGENSLASIVSYTGDGGAVTVPATVTVTGNGADTVYTVSEIDIHTFDVSAVEAFTVEDGSQYFTADEYGVLFADGGATLLRYPAASLLTTYTIPDTVTYIASFAFAGVQNLETLYIPTAALQSMGEMVFRGCNDKLAVYAGMVEIPDLSKKDQPAALVPETSTEITEGTKAKKNENTDGE